VAPPEPVIQTVFVEPPANRVSLLVGYGPIGLKRTENPEVFEVQREYGGVLGIQYSRAMGSYSGTVGLLTNQTGLLGAGYEF